MHIVKMIYSDVINFPKDEFFGLKSQIQRASISIPSNIAEGSSRTSDKEFSRYLEIALGSSFEVETQLIIAHEIGFISTANYNELLNLVNKNQKQINSFISKLKANDQKPNAKK